MCDTNEISDVDAESIIPSDGYDIAEPEGSLVQEPSWGDLPVATDSARSQVEGDGPVLSQLQSEQFVTNSFLSNAEWSAIRLPWETGIYRNIFSDDGAVNDLVPRMPVSCNLTPLPDSSSLEVRGANPVEPDIPVVGGAVFLQAVFSLADKTEADKRAAIIEAAVHKWVTIVKQYPGDFQKFDSGSSGYQPPFEIGDEDIFGNVRAMVGVRSPLTIMKRANSLLAFLRWSSNTCVIVDSPFTEELAWMYFKHLKDSHAAATVASGCMSSFRFAFFVLGCEQLENVVNSRRLVGLADQLLTNKGLLAQARPLHVYEVMTLHNILVDKCRHLMDRVACGFLLIALYGRCRHSDLSHVHSIDHDWTQDGGFLEVKTAWHKTARSAASKTMLLPILIPAIGVNGSVWVQDVSDVFAAAGLPFGQIDGLCSPRQNLMPIRVFAREASLRRNHPDSCGPFFK